MEEILLNSLANSGVPIPPSVSTIRDLSPSTLFSVSSRAVRLIDRTASFPASLPDDSMADRIKLCTDLASAFKSLGFTGDLSFHKFLYPTEEDLYKLVRFLVERLPGSAEARRVADEKGSISPRGIRKEDYNVGKLLKKQINEDDDVHSSLASAGDTGKKVSSSIENVQDSIRRIEDLKICDTGDRGAPVPRDKEHGPEYPQNIDFSEHSFEINRTILELQCEEDLLKAELNRKTSELQHLLDDHALLKSAVEMACDDQHSIDFYLEQLTDQMEVKRRTLEEVRSQWEATRESMDEKRGILEEEVAAKLPQAYEMLGQVKNIKLETESVLAEIKQREEELFKLSADLEKQPQLAPRRSYIQRIKEITKNSWKQDTDIERILRETRELQLESNIIQERLHRTYAVVDEMVFREAKKDPVGRQAYRHLASIHENFEQIAETILATDRTRREVADYEAKLATVTSRGLNLDKLKADLDAIRKENDLLQQRLHDGGTS